MTLRTTHIGRTARRLAMLAVSLLVAATGPAAATGGYVGGMMGGGMGGLGLFGGGLFLWPLLLVGLVVLLVYRTDRDEETARTDTALAELRERYARGDLSDEEFEERRAKLSRETSS